MQNELVVVRRSLKTLTKKFELALVLGQLVYWCARTRDSKEYIQEEIKSLNGSKIEMESGWIQKSARTLDEELMTDVSDGTMLGYLKQLSRWVISRKIKGEHKYEYRVQLHMIIQDLRDLQVSAAEFESILNLNPISETKDQSSETENQSSILEDLVLKNDLKNQNTYKNEYEDESGTESWIQKLDWELQGIMFPDESGFTPGSVYTLPATRMLKRFFSGKVETATIEMMSMVHEELVAEYRRQGLTLVVRNPVGWIRNCFEIGLQWHVFMKELPPSQREQRMKSLRFSIWKEWQRILRLRAA